MIKKIFTYEFLLILKINKSGPGLVLIISLLGKRRAQRAWLPAGWHWSCWWQGEGSSLGAGLGHPTFFFSSWFSWFGRENYIFLSFHEQNEQKQVLKWRILRSDFKLLNEEAQAKLISSRRFSAAYKLWFLVVNLYLAQPNILATDSYIQLFIR